MFNKHKYYREQFKNRKVFKDLKDYEQKTEYSGVEMTESYYQNNQFSTFDLVIKYAGLVTLVACLGLLIYIIYSVFGTVELSF